MVKRKRQQQKYDSQDNIQVSREDSSFLNEQQENISDIFNKLSFEDLKDSDNIDDLIINFTKKIHVSSTQSSNFIDTKSMQLRAELQQLRKHLMAHYKDIDTVNWMSQIIIDEIKSQKLKEMKSVSEIPTVSELQKREDIEEFINKIDFDEILNDLDYE